MTYFLRRFYDYIGRRTRVPIKVIFSNGSIYQNSKNRPLLKITYKNKIAEIWTLLFDDMGLFESYIYQWVDVDGDLSKIGQIADDCNFEETFLNPLNHLRNHWHNFLHSGGTIKKALENARFQYADRLELFRNFLGPSMLYSCAYYQSDAESLEEAQLNKLEQICKRIRLQKGETLVDVGSGWGTLLLYAYERYGALGTSVDPVPNEYLKREIKKRHLEGKITIQERDYREAKGQFDKYVSIEVFEHAGKQQHNAWMKSIKRILKKGGLGVLAFSGHLEEMDTDLFIRKYIFQGAYMPSLGETLEVMGKNGLEVLDVENIRRHYAPTLTQWAVNFDKNWGKIQRSSSKKYDERFRRMWRLFLWATASEFGRKNTKAGVFHITFSNGDVGKEYPMRRDFLYQ